METRTNPNILTVAEQVELIAHNEIEMRHYSYTTQYSCEVTASALMREYKETGDDYSYMARRLTALAESIKQGLEQ